MGTVQFAWDYDLNMDSCQVALFVVLALFLQCQQLNANDCKRRTTFIQIRIPQRTNVAVKYPKEINSVQYVPFPYLPSGSQCIKCQDAACNKCSSIKPPSYSMVHARKTNIVIDIKGSRKLNESTANAPKNSSGTVDGTIVGIYDRTSATSKSGATATTSDKGNSSAATASGTSSSQIDTLAALNEEVINKDTGEKSNVEDIYAASEDGSTADANSTAAGEPDKKEKSSKSDSDKSDKSSDKKSSDDGKAGKDSSGAESKPKDDKKAGDESAGKTHDDSSSDAAKSSSVDTSDKDDKGDAPTEVEDASDKDKKPVSADADSHGHDTISDADSSLDKPSATATAKATGS